MPEGKLFEDAVQVAAGATGLGGGLYGLRWLINWLTQWSERRAARLDVQEERADQQWKEIRETIRRQLADAQSRLEKVEQQNMAMRRAFNHLAAALIRIDPQHRALAEADRILALAFPDDFEIAAARAEAALDRAQQAGG
ncbi:hypothetical protein PX699_00325 [Sphingobium sp. H39-3-25]|uniref:hypothetical protein n=1 Tax=Sphingobium arseniciresistens TaxID=3030834 RepID=UPI0023B8BC6A|nr:hypothetical protein [Sphingobium arseniciresistens]